MQNRPGGEDSSKSARSEPLGVLMAPLLSIQGLGDDTFIVHVGSRLQMGRCHSQIRDLGLNFIA